MPRADFHIQTPVAPEHVMGAMLDFSDRRPELWPGLARRYYEVYEVGETSAFVREGSGFPAFVWAKERYDWSTPWKVSWTAEESNFSTPGSGATMHVSPAEGGGSDIRLEWHREPSSLKGRLIIPMIAANNGKQVRTFTEKALAHLAKQPNLPTYSPPGS